MLDAIVERIKTVDGVQAVVLGGSRGRGTHAPDSDYDIGICYEPDLPLDLIALNGIATELDDEHRPDLLTLIGGWGPRINGGGWLRIRSQAVDFIYRDLAKVRAVIDDCIAGRIEMHYQPGHPHGFVSSIYMAEVATCAPLWDPSALIATLKARTHPYPPALKRALIDKFAWEIDFSLKVAEKGILRRDVSYISGGCWRAVACMVQVLFALSEQYLLNEKGAVAQVDSLRHHPREFSTRVEHVFSSLRPEKHAMSEAIARLAELGGETTALIAGFAV